MSGAPHDDSIERAILGAILLNPEVRDRALQAGVSSATFFREPNRLIWNAMGRVEHIDIVTVGSALGSTALQAVGGYTALTNLQAVTPSIAHSRTYFKKALEFQRLRKIREACLEAVDRVADREEGGDAASIAAAVQGDLEYGEADSGGRWVHSSELIERTMASIKDRYENPGIRGLTTGLRDLDSLLLGIGDTHLVIIMGRPASGKTSVVLGILTHVATKLNKAVGMFSLEMDDESLANRLLGSEGRVAGDRIRTGRLRDDDWPALYQAAERLHGAPFYIHDAPIKTPAELRSKVKSLHRKHPNLGCIIVDYVQLLTDEGGKSKDRREAVDKIARSMKNLARGLHVPVIALAQPNRQCESRVDKRPNMGDLRESGELENAADTIIAVYRDEVYNPETEDKGIAELIVRKARFGATGTARVAWRAEFTRFENLARDV